MYRMEVADLEFPKGEGALFRNRVKRGVKDITGDTWAKENARAVRVSYIDMEKESYRFERVGARVEELGAGHPHRLCR